MLCLLCNKLNFSPQLEAYLKSKLEHFCY
jgi:hypothetical protein